MKKNMLELKEKFEIIKKSDLVSSLRRGNTGIGYTFECLINKKEDKLYYPDFKGIEIKTKLGYSKSPMTLFCLTPIKDNDYCIKYLLTTFGYPNKNYNLKNLRGNSYHNKNNIIANKFIFKLRVDRINKKINLIILNQYLEVIDNTIYWPFDNIKNRLLTKLNYLAIIEGYPYYKNNLKYYKYTKINFYKLISFEQFLNLIENDIIFISFNIGTHTSKEKYGAIYDRGTAFRINTQDIEKLFEKMPL